MRDTGLWGVMIGSLIGDRTVRIPSPTPNTWEPKTSQAVHCLFSALIYLAVLKDIKHLIINPNGLPEWVAFTFWEMAGLAIINLLSFQRNRSMRAKRLRNSNICSSRWKCYVAIWCTCAKLVPSIKWRTGLRASSLSIACDVTTTPSRTVVDCYYLRVSDKIEQPHL